MMMFINKMREEKGFTLVELLIVIAILAVLAVAAAPRFISYKLQADANTCKNNQATIETALEQVIFSDSTKTYATIALADLHGTGKPLKTEPKCPGKGTYSWTTGTVTCNFSPADASDPSHTR